MSSVGEGKTEKVEDQEAAEMSSGVSIEKGSLSRIYYWLGNET